MKFNIFRFTFLISTASLAVLYFEGCTSESTINPNSVFRYNEFRNITSLDPAFARNPQNIWPIQQLFNGLVQLDNQLNVIPEIAKEWQIDSLGLTYTFFLRQDVNFHPSPLFGDQLSRRVKAKDFSYSFDRLTNPEVGSPGGWVLQQVDHYRALNDSVFQIKLKKPFPAFLSLLSMQYCSVVPQEVIEYPGYDFRKNPIGTGPFRFKAWQEDVKLVLRKNPFYFEYDQNGQPLPYLEAIAIQFIPDIQSEFMLFSQGKLDFLNSIDPSYKDELLTPDGTLQPKYGEQIYLQKGPYLNTEYIGLYLESDNKALQSKKIRQAMNLGFDREKMVIYLRNTIGFPATHGFIPEGLAGKYPEPLTGYQPEKARRLVQEYIHEYREEPHIRLATDVNYLDVCEYLQRELQKIGIDIKIELMPTATLRQAKSNGKLETFRASWIADYPDAENYLSLFYSKNFSPRGPNYTHFKLDAFDQSYEKAKSIKSINERILLYQKMDKMIMDSYPIIPLYYDQAIRFVQKNVTDLEMNPLNLIQLKTVKKKD